MLSRRFGIGNASLDAGSAGVYVVTMPCPYSAILLVTRDVHGTSSSVAKERTMLSCAEAVGHEGPHRDDRANIRWDDQGLTVRMLLSEEGEQLPEYFQ